MKGLLRGMLVAATVMLAAGGTARANLITNGGFEDGMTGWTSFNPASGSMSASPLVPISGQYSLRTTSFTGARGAPQTWGITQAFSAPAGAALLVSFKYNTYYQNTSAGFANVLAEILLNDAVIATLPTTTMIAVPQQVSVNAVAAGNDVLKINIPAIIDSFVFRLDDVSVTLAQVTVPEPATVALFGLGLAGILAARRRARPTA
jgi:hypothetical protein